jgi:hypothetical protein
MSPLVVSNFTLYSAGIGGVLGAAFFVAGAVAA